VNPFEQNINEIPSTAFLRVDPKKGWRTQCGNCQVWFADKAYHYTPLRSGVRSITLILHRCPHCDEWNFERLEWLKKDGKDQHSHSRLWPPERKGHVVLAPEVPADYAADLREAFAVLPVSGKASAALSRRLLQRTLHDRGIKKRNLDGEIEELLKSKILPSYIADDVDAIRTVGNFAAHPIKSKNTGEIVDVEPGEAEWLLRVILALFDQFFVQPARQQSRRDELNKKLKESGKPELKVPPK